MAIYSVDEAFRAALVYYIKNGKRGYQGEISKKSGIDPPALSAFLNNKVGRGLTEDKKRAVLLAVGSMEKYFMGYDEFLSFGLWMLDGKDPDVWSPPSLQMSVEMNSLFTNISSDHTSKHTDRKVPSPTTPEPDLLYVPRVKAKLCAGTGVLVYDESIAAKYAFRSAWLHTKGQPNNMVIFFVTGESMIPEIKHNDMVMVDQSQNDVVSDQIYAVAIDGNLMVKQVRIEPGKVVLHSLNEKFADITIKDEDDIKIVGRVVWSAREY